MKPRLLSSKKWTLFPRAYTTQIQEVFEEAFKKQLQTGKLIVEGRIYPEEILLRVGYLEKNRLAQNNFEISAAYATGKDDPIDKIHSCIDAAASLMNEYFESEGQVEFPITWKNYDFDGKEIWVQHSTVNSTLESEADKLLGFTESKLLQTEPETDDALEVSEIIADEGELPGPQIFGGKKKKKEDLH